MKSSIKVGLGEFDSRVAFNMDALIEDKNKVINIVYKNINKRSKFSKCVFKDLKSYKTLFLNNPKKKIVNIFGKKGSCLYDFLSICNVEHPDIFDVLNGIFNPSNFKSLLDFIDLSDYASKETPGIQNNVNKSARQYFNSYLKKSSINPSLYIRLLKDKSEVQKLRNKKESSRVCIDLDRWMSTADDFSKYCYGVDSFDDEVKLATEKSNALKAYGLNEFSKMIMDSVATKEESYYGFNRLNMGDASIILAKQHGYNFSDYDSLKVFSSPVFNIPSALKASSKVGKILNKIEKFDKVGNRALFDHLFVLYTFGDFEKQLCVDKFKTLCEKEACSYLIRNEIISPVILGERSGKCYFVSYWS